MSHQKTAILDRDGVINEYPGDYEYVKSWAEFRFLPRAKQAIKLLKDNGFKVFVASNQAGVSKGIYTQIALEDITKRMQAELDLAGARIDEVNYCTHTDADNCFCRKPKSGMLKKAVEKPNSDTYFIGDTQRDVATGHDFGCKTILVLCGKIKNQKETKGWQQKPDLIVADLWEAAYAIINGRVK